jgi:hypothetical protein
MHTHYTSLVFYCCGPYTSSNIDRERKRERKRGKRKRAEDVDDDKLYELSSSPALVILCNERLSSLFSHSWKKEQFSYILSSFTTVSG